MRAINAGTTPLFWTYVPLCLRIVFLHFASLLNGCVSLSRAGLVVCAIHLRHLQLVIFVETFPRGGCCCHSAASP